MKQFLLGSFTGTMISILVGYFWFYPICKTNWRNVGKNNGAIDTSCKLYKKTESLFGAKKSDEVVISSFASCKEVDIVVVEKDGILTIRATP